MADEMEATQNEDTQQANEQEPVATEEKTDETPDVPSAEEWARTRAALAKANKEAATFRHELKKLREQSETDAERSKREAAEAAAKEAEGRYKPIVVKALASAKLKDSGYLGKNPASMIGLLDMDALSVTEDGGVDGLDDEIKRLKTEYPDLFGRVTPSANAAPKAPPSRKLSSSERLAALVEGAK